VELVGDAAADPAGTADDVVIGKTADFAFHSSPAKSFFELEFDERLGQRPDQEEDQRHADDDHESVEDAPGVGQGMYFLIADGRKGCQRHVEPIEERPAFDEMESQRADDEQQENSDGQELDVTQGLHVVAASSRQPESRR
jgi:hypothetical protein